MTGLSGISSRSLNLNRAIRQVKTYFHGTLVKRFGLLERLSYSSYFPMKLPGIGDCNLVIKLA